MRKQPCERCADREAQAQNLALMLSCLIRRLGGSVEITPYELISTRKTRLTIARSDDVMVGGANIVLRRDFFGIEDIIEVTEC